MLTFVDSASAPDTLRSFRSCVRLAVVKDL